MRYDRTGRAILASLWEAIANKPDRIVELAALVDPDALRYVGWNDTTNQLELLEFDPSDIPYDNTVSGLTATDVKAALDELAAGSGGVYAGYVSAAGTTATSKLPAGWTVTRPITGEYVVTHSLGLASGTDLAVVAQAINVQNSTYKTSLPTAGLLTNSFRVIVDSNSPNTNAAFFFHAKLIA